MISSWKLIKIARKWQKAAALRRRRISFPQPDRHVEHSSSSKTPSVSGKGHFVVYSVDRKRFEFPIKYLSNCVIRELLRLSEEEFGLPGDRPITLPCDANFMEQIISLLRAEKGKDLQKPELLISVAARQCSLSYSDQQRHVEQQILVST